MKVTDVRRITDLPHVNIYRARFEHAGREGQWLYVRREGARDQTLPDAVAVVPILNGRLVLIRQFRVPLQDYVLEFPAGLIEPGSTVEATAARELEEETGLKIERVLHVSPIIYNTPGLSDESCCCVFAEVSGALSTRGNEASEDIELLALDDAEIAELLSRGDDRIDAKCWTILHLRAALGL